MFGFYTDHLVSGENMFLAILHTALWLAGQYFTLWTRTIWCCRLNTVTLMPCTRQFSLRVTSIFLIILVPRILILHSLACLYFIFSLFRKLQLEWHSNRSWAVLTYTRKGLKMLRSRIRLWMNWRNIWSAALNLCFHVFFNLHGNFKAQQG